MFCPKCGHKNDVNAHYCDKCGQDLKLARHFKDKDKWGRWWKSQGKINKILLIGLCIVGIIGLGYYISIITEDPLTHLDLYNLTAQTPGNIIQEIDLNTTEYTVKGETADGAVITVTHYPSDGKNETLKLESKNRFTYKIPISPDESAKSTTFTAEKKGKTTSEIILIIYRPDPTNSDENNQAIQTVKDYGSNKSKTIVRGFDIAYTASEDMSSGTWAAKPLTNENYLVINQFEYKNSQKQAIFLINMKTGEVIGLNYVAKIVLDAINDKDIYITYFGNGFFFDM